LLSVENPGYIFVRESVAIMEETYKPFHQKKKGSSSSKPSTTSSRRCSVSEYPRSIEEDTARRGGTTLFSSVA
jgi:hypothetical protein